MRSQFINRVKGSIQVLFRRLGFNIYRLRQVQLAGYTYESVIPKATYAPWRMDVVFGQTYDAVKLYTFVDQYRCYELWTLVEQSKKLAHGALIEIGVWRGGSGALIAKKAKSIGIREKVYLCDTFRGVVKAGSEDVTFYKGGEHANTNREIVEKLTRGTLGLDNVEILEGIFPDETAHLITDKQFRFCHIDVDTYLSAKEVVEWIWDKMVTGGIIVFDDYGFKYCEGVTTYVEEIKKLPDRLFVHNLNGHAIVIKKSV